MSAELGICDACVLVLVLREAIFWHAGISDTISPRRRSCLDPHLILITT